MDPDEYMSPAGMDKAIAMATASLEFNTATAVERLLAIPDLDERTKVLSTYSSNQRKKIKAMLKEKRELTEAKGKQKAVEAAPPAPQESEEEDVDWTGLPAPGTVAPQTIKKVSSVEESEIDALWSFIDDSDTTMAENLSDFDYQGFNADSILREFLTRGKKANVSMTQMKQDITSLAALAHKKGSITENNYTKLAKTGQARYDVLAARYGLQKGGGKGKGPDVLTVSRIGPTVPGRILRLILAGKLAAKRFNGPFKSSGLPDVMQTQAFPAIIPESLEDPAKQYIISLCVAYSADQSHALQKKKDKPEDLLTAQTNFVLLGTQTSHPPENQKLDMFKSIDWPNIFDKTIGCATQVKKINPEFSLVSRADFLSSVSKLS